MAYTTYNFKIKLKVGDVLDFVPFGGGAALPCIACYEGKPCSFSGNRRLVINIDKKESIVTTMIIQTNAPENVLFVEKFDLNDPSLMHYNKSKTCLDYWRSYDQSMQARMREMRLQRNNKENKGQKRIPKK